MLEYAPMLHVSYAQNYAGIIRQRPTWDKTQSLFMNTNKLGIDSSADHHHWLQSAVE